MATLKGLNVALVAEYSNTGGAKRYAGLLLDFYIRCNCNVILVDVLLGDGESILESVPRVVERIDASSLAGRQENFRPFFKIPKKNKKFAKIIKSLEIDLLVCSVSCPGLFLPSLGASFPVIYILHSYPRSMGNWFKDFARRFAVRELVPPNVTITSVSKYSIDQIDLFWGCGGALGQSKLPISGTAGELKKAVRLESRAGFLVVTIGHVVGYKNPFLWIEMAKLLCKSNEQMNCIWVGDGPDLTSCRLEVESCGLEDKIRFIGHDSCPEKYLREATVYVQPSQIESLGLAVIEAMSHSVPCVVSSAGGLPEVVQDDLTGKVVRNLDGRSFADAVFEIVTLPERYERYRRSCRDYYELTFSLLAWERRLLKVHCEALTKT